MKWLFKNPEEVGRLVDPIRIEEKYFQLHDEYANLTGGDFSLEKVMILMVKRMEARVKVAAGDKSAWNFIHLYTDMIDRLLESGSDVDVIKTRMSVQQAYGMPIDPHKTPVPEYVKIMDLVKDQADARRQSLGHGEN